MVWAFEAQASGEWTLKIAAQRTGRSRPDHRARAAAAVEADLGQPATPLPTQFLLRREDHLRGVEYDGLHPSLIDQEVWQRVQDLLSSRNVKGEKYRSHNHYVKSSLFCGRCGSR